MSEHDDLTAKRTAKIEALLRKAESTDHPEEAKTFTEKAQALMVEWAISEAMIRTAKPIEDIRDEIAHETIIIRTGATTVSDQQLICRIADALNLQHLFTRQRTPHTGKRPAQIYMVFGFPDDLARFRLLWESLRQQRDHALNSPEVKALQAYDADEGGYRTAGARGGHALRFRNAFCIAYAAEIGERLTVVHQQVVDSAPGTAIVLANQADVLANWYEEQFPNTKATRTAVRGSQLGGAAGRRAGQKASIASGEIGS